jgi:hypothetical protein
MGLADDLLQQADHLLTYEGDNPSQASLRRAVSTAYYALFHLLIEDAAQRWQGSLEACTGIQRAFAHGQMKDVSKAFTERTWLDWHGNRQPVPPALHIVANAFVGLQEERHAADYDNNEQWSVTEVRAHLNTARSAFEAWHLINNDPMAGNYLLSMLLGRPRK